MKKTLLITKFFPPETGGIQNYLYHLFLNLEPEKVAVFCDSKVTKQLNNSSTKQRDPSSQTPQDDVAFAPSFKIYRTDFDSSWRILHLTTLALFRKLRPILAAEKPEYLLCGHLPIAGPLAFMVKKFYNFPYAIFTHGMEISGIKKLPASKQKMFLRILREADKIITTTDFMADLLAREFGLDRKKMIKIPPGTVCHSERSEESPANEGSRIRERSFPRHNQNYVRGQDDRKKIPRNDKKILLTVARLVARKNHATVIRALPEIIREIPNLEYQIAGTGPEEKNLRNLVAQLKLEKSVRFLGYVPEEKLPELYANADVFVMPSYDDPKTGDIEGFGIVFLEAAASGIPAIAGRSGGQPEAVLNEKTGLLVEPRDVTSVSVATLRLLKNPDLAQKMGAAGRARVAQEFQWPQQARKLLKILE